MTIKTAASARDLHVLPADQVSAGRTLKPTVIGATNTPLAYADTEAEAELARLAFEQVLLPRFTRDEAIAIVLDSPVVARVQRHPHDAPFYLGVRAALEALAAAGVFSDGKNMTDRLDAAGIR